MFQILHSNPPLWMIDETYPQQTHTRILTYFCHQKARLFLSSIVILLSPFPLPSPLLLGSIVMKLKFINTSASSSTKQSNAVTLLTLMIQSVGVCISAMDGIWIKAWTLPSLTQVHICKFTNLYHPSHHAPMAVLYIYLYKYKSYIIFLQPEMESQGLGHLPPPLWDM